MRRVAVLTAAAVLLLPLAASSQKVYRNLASAKLDASQSYDFSCNVVNKNDESDADWGDKDFEVTLTLKDADGDVYVDPSTFLPATLTQTLEPGEAAMLVAPAAFAGLTSLYCWARVPEDVTAFGTFLVRDAQDRSTAAVPLEEDLVGLFFDLLGKAHEVDAKLDWLIGNDF